MFLGTFTPKLLAKNQIVLPAKIRSALGSDRAILTAGFDKCLYGFTLEDWNKTTGFELSKPLSTSDGRFVRHQLFAKATEIDLDEQGRFVVPENLKNFANLNDDLAIIGAGDHFEIWDKKEWEKING